MSNIYRIIGYCARSGVSASDVLATPVNHLEELMNGIEYWILKEKEGFKK